MAALYMVNFILFLFCTIRCRTHEVKPASDTFHEELFIKPLASEHVYSYFQFTTVWNTSSQSNPYQHCHLFPRALGEIITRHNVQELHVSLTEGLWRHEKWGYPVFDAPPGAEVWVWFKDGTQNFRHAGVVSEPGDSRLLKYGTLPQEIVCTENLTPWKKLLPCDSKKGLATLLNAGYIYNTNYHSLGIHVRDICRSKACTETSIELKQTLSLVHDFVILESGNHDISIRKLFGSGLKGHCPLAKESKIYIDITSSVPLELNPPPSFKTFAERGGSRREIAVYDLKDFQGMFNIAVTNREKSQGSQEKYPPLLWANRFISGYGRQKGGIVTKLFNRHWRPLNVVILENIPWFVPVYLHTLKVISGGNEIKPAVVKYIPGNQRLNAAHLELLLQLPPRSETEISMDFDYVFLKWQEYPPDACHGFYIGSSVITTLLPLAKNYTGIPQDESLFGSGLNASRDGYLVQLRTESMIITLPTPDFSMPYNVICFACTVVALAFGPIHNFTTKKLRVSKTKKPQGLFWQLIWKVWGAVKSRKKSSAEEEEDEEENKKKKD